MYGGIWTPPSSDKACFICVVYELGTSKHFLCVVYVQGASKHMGHPHVWMPPECVDTPICLDAPICLEDFWMPPVHKESMPCHTKGCLYAHTFGCLICLDAPI